MVFKDHSSAIGVEWQQVQSEHYSIRVKGDSNPGGHHGEGSRE